MRIVAAVDDAVKRNLAGDAEKVRKLVNNNECADVNETRMIQNEEG